MVLHVECFRPHWPRSLSSPSFFTLFADIVFALVFGYNLVVVDAHILDDFCSGSGSDFCSNCFERIHTVSITWLCLGAGQDMTLYRRVCSDNQYWPNCCKPNETRITKSNNLRTLSKCNNSHQSMTLALRNVTTYKKKIDAFIEEEKRVRMWLLI